MFILMNKTITSLLIKYYINAYSRPNKIMKYHSLPKDLYLV